ncbi:hypothetical protein KIN20_003439 [Parelaphostrongylus tenuis]|uniref:Uncharacterized protein n=1 Tax=Parelaphostrongylus tenuis TaxID=148309 RepID=A0AAD5QIL5_PARTN|nr:hypothetical protein KIN20_003439 [Parelaphostrongylus tenuis]
MPLPHCIIVGNTVTALCTGKGANENDKCIIARNMKIAPIDDKHLSISGSLTTANIVMANWSRQMWQCSEQSDSNVGIGSVFLAILLCICNGRIEREVNNEVIELNCVLFRLMSN